MLTQSDASSEKADVLVNHAGIMQLAKISDADDGFFDRHIAINLKGVFNGMREAAKRPARRRQDHQLFIQCTIDCLPPHLVGKYRPPAVAPQNASRLPLFRRWHAACFSPSKTVGRDPVLGRDSPGASQ
jgi:NAD(P)-dependent dehydrogenase (short-subunit alcohol dehydrogenase family)